MVVTSAQGQGPLLVVDLDGTLLKSDALHESFWAAFSQNWVSPFGCMLALLRGKAALKRHLALAGALDVGSLPYNAEVLSYISAWRTGGGRAVLVTAGDQYVADAVAGHLGCFEGAYGSDGRTNLKGANKAAFIAQTFGPDGVAYMGDAYSDLAVWETTGHAITVDAPAGLRARVEHVAEGVEHLGTATRSQTPYLRALRPHQWLKNLLVFLPPLAAHDLSAGTLGAAGMAFVAFCLVASGVYVLNDLLDLAADRGHPRKRQRPFASGALSIKAGLPLVAGLFAAGALTGAAIGWGFLGALALYFLITTAYSLYMKRRMVIDICTLAVLYALRILAGGLATGITLSVWLLAFAAFLFFSLAAIKRQAELVDAAGRGALSASGRGYGVNDLHVVTMMAIASGYVAVMVLALYVDAAGTSGLYTMPELLWGACLILLFWISRLALITSRGRMHDDPLLFAVRDATSLWCGGLILMCGLGASVL